MPTKSFLVKVELIVQKISCPGVWLCSNGKVSLQLSMLDSTIQTEVYKPYFPLHFEEKFIFYKTFVKERRLNELQRSLGREWLCAELIQWKNCEEGVILACFKTTLDDLLYPSAFKSANMPGTDVDLLLEPTKLFPGTISPKLELRTKTTIEETFSEMKQRCTNKILHNNPVKSSCFTQSFPKKLHSRKVCHTTSYSRAQQRCKDAKKESRPMFKYKRAEDDLILRNNPDKVLKDDIVVALNKYDLQMAGYEVFPKVSQKTCKHCMPYCYCSNFLGAPEYINTRSFMKGAKTNNMTNNSLQPIDPYCSCEIHHKPQMCPLCIKYESTFSSLPKKPIKSKEFLSQAVNTSDSLAWCTNCKKHFQDKKGNSIRPIKKVCFCLDKKENSLNLAQRLHVTLRNGLQNGAACMETCIKKCQISE